MKPKISVLIPVYNVETYLDECVRSVLQQDFNDYELLLLDDGSTDSSGALCDKLQAECRQNTRKRYVFSIRPTRGC